MPLFSREAEQVKATPGRKAPVSAEEIRREVGRKFACPCESPLVKSRTRPDGSRQYVRQCPRCGKCSRPISRDSLDLFERRLALPVDETIREKWEADQAAYAAQLRAEMEAEASAQFFSRYSEYLRSPEWIRKRNAVLKRDGYQCQGCLSARATQAHHLTYERVFHEMLFDLIAVCGPCHERLHPRKGGKRGE